MRTPFVLIITAIACLTITYGFVQAANISFDGKGPADQVEAEFNATWSEGRPDDASREKLGWLACQTKRFDDARKIFAEVHSRHQPGAAWSALWSDDLGKMAQVEICATKFNDALRLYEEQLQYDSQFLARSTPVVRRDLNNIAVVRTLIAQTKSNDKPQQEQHLARAEEALQAASRGADPKHELIALQSALIIAQQRGDRQAVDASRKAVEIVRSQMKLKVPVVQF